MMVPVSSQFASVSVVATALFMAMPVLVVLLPKVLRSVKARRFAVAFMVIFVLLGAAQTYAIYFPLPCDPMPERWSFEWWLCW